MSNYPFQNDIKIVTEEGKIKVTSPFNNKYREDAKAIGGKWNADDKAWVFNAKIESRVIDLVKKHYGNTGPEEQVTTLRITATGELDSHSAPLFAGRVVVWADANGPHIVEDAVLLEGAAHRYGAGNRTALDEGTVIEVEGFPVSAAQLAQRQWADRHCARSRFDCLKVEIVETKSVGIDVGSLQEELERIENRAAEIRKILNVKEAA
jgi:hypothetical protein